MVNSDVRVTHLFIIETERTLTDIKMMIVTECGTPAIAPFVMGTFRMDLVTCAKCKGK